MVKDAGRYFVAFLLMGLVAAAGAQALTIDIDPGSGLSGNAAALSAFQRAANQWASHFSDPITVTIKANLTDMGSGSIIGSTAPVVLQGGYATIRTAMVNDAALDPDDGIAAFLPTATQFSALVPNGFGLNGLMLGTKANFKALGFANLDASFGVMDATITFNSGFSFDYDNSNGVLGDAIDFETVAAHEIGHVLGFVSIVDTVDSYLAEHKTFSIEPTPLDLYRFADGTQWDPVTTTDFTYDPRNLVPGYAAVFDDLTHEWAMSTGAYYGDGNQASHWKDNGLTGFLIGLMDPTLAYGQVINLTEADLRALDLIGYDTRRVPLPTSILLLGTGLACLAIFQRRSQTRAGSGA